MSKIWNFVRTAAIGGFLVIVPIAIMLFVLGQLLFALYSLAVSLLTALNLEVNDALLLLAISVAALIGLCFVTGLLLQTKLGDVLRNWLNRHIGDRIPMYNALSSLTQRFAGNDGENFLPVEIDLYGSGARVIGFEIESLPENRSAVFVPSAPVATVGNVYVVATSQLQYLPASVADTLSAITQWGVDTKLLYGSQSGKTVNKKAAETAE